MKSCIDRVSPIAVQCEKLIYILIIIIIIGIIIINNSLVHNESIFVIYRNTIKSPPKTTKE